MTNYEKRKSALREQAIEWQLNFAENNLSYGAIRRITNYFYTQAKRYGLLKEFKENGVL